MSFTQCVYSSHSHSVTPYGQFSQLQTVNIVFSSMHVPTMHHSHTIPLLTEWLISLLYQTCLPETTVLQSLHHPGPGMVVEISPRGTVGWVKGNQPWKHTAKKNWALRYTRRSLDIMNWRKGHRYRTHSPDNVSCWRYGKALALDNISSGNDEASILWNIGAFFYEETEYINSSSHI